jgi:hypothetical protein
MPSNADLKQYTNTGRNLQILVVFHYKNSCVLFLAFVQGKIVYFSQNFITNSSIIVQSLHTDGCTNISKSILHAINLLAPEFYI